MMPVIPSKEALGVVTAQPNRRIASVDTSAVGAGMQSFAAGLGSAANDIASVARVKRKENAVADASRANAFYLESALKTAREIEDNPDYSKYGETWEKQSSEFLTKSANLIRDPKVRERWTAQKQSDVILRSDKILSLQDKKADEANRVALATSIETNQNIFTDPAITQDEKAQALDNITAAVDAAEATGLLGAADAKKWRDTYVRGSILAEAEIRAKTDPEFAKSILAGSSSGDREGYFAAIRNAESGGNDAAKNPTSTATGRYQFVKGTWDSLRKRYPEAGLTAGGRLDPEQQEIAIRLFTAENENALGRSGIEITGGSLYAAHFLGSGGATNVLTKEGSSLVSEHVGSDVIKANSFLKGMTVNQFKAWAEKKAGGKGEVLREGVYASLSPEDRMKLQGAAKSSAASSTRESIGLQILQDPFSITETDISQNEYIDDGQRASLVRELRTEMKRVKDETDASSWASSPGGSNPFDPDAKKFANLSYKKSVSSGGNPQQIAEAMAESKGVVPKAYVNELRAGLLSGSASEVSQAASMSYRLAKLAPQAMRAVDGNSDIIKAAASYDHYVNDMGYSAEAAGKKLQDINDPAKVKEREALLSSKIVKDKLKGIDAGHVSDRTSEMFGTFFDYKVGVNDAHSEQIAFEYRQYYEESLIDAGGDFELADKLADEKFKRNYAPSGLSLSGDSVIIKAPPELAYPPLPDGSHDYLRTQAQEALSGEGIDAEDIYLQKIDGQTEQSIRSGSPVPYQVFYKDADGFMQSMPYQFFGDYNAALGEYESSRKMEQAITVEQSKERFQENLDRNLTGRETSLDAYLAGPAKIGGN